MAHREWPKCNKNHRKQIKKNREAWKNRFKK